MTFEEIYGHKRQIAILKSALARDRIAHAYLFHGMEGIGKRTAAAVFARALNCPAAEPPCDACPACRKAERGNHPDIITVKPEGQFIKIGAIRELQERLTFRPSEGRRVFLMPEADRMNAPAANALLKTLEEPTAGNILLLTSARPYALPMTILSRCQPLRFSPLARKEVERYLREQRRVAADTAAVIAASAGGSIGRALEMGEEDYLAARDAVLDYVASDSREELLARLAFAGRLGTEREEILERLRILASCYRDALIFREIGEPERLMFRDRIGVIQRIAGRLSGRQILANMAAIRAASDAIEKNANKPLTLESLMVRLN